MCVHAACRQQAGNATVEAAMVNSSGDNSGEGGGGEKGGINTNDTNTKPITIREVGELIGMDHPVSVMDVKTQDEMEGWIISDLVEYFEDEDRLYQIRQQQLLELNLLSTTREMKKHTMRFSKLG